MMTSQIYKAIVLVIILHASYKVDTASLDITPDGFLEAVTDAVFISCRPDETGAKAKQILVIEISKDENKPIVHIQPPDLLHYGSTVKDHFVIQGLINNSDISDSFLNITINYPSEEDAGTYKCVMSYIDNMDLVKQDTAQKILRLNASDSSNLDIRVKNLEAALDNLLDRVKDVEKDNARLEAENKNLTSHIQVLKEKADTTVAFSAAINVEKGINTGDVLVFGDVMINEGQGYNSTNGIFTAPLGGLYAFHLVLEVGQGGAIGEVCLNVAGKDMAKMYIQDKDFGDQGAISIVSRLKAGDTVKALVYLATGNNPRVFSERLCVFSGFLIRI